MNGFEQIKSFYSWVFNNPDKVRPTHISLYLFLWNQANRANWAEWVKCPYDLAMQGACIGNKGTYYNCLDQLKVFGLIEYQKGINNFKAPLIKLIRLYDNEQLTEQVTVPQSEPLHVPLPVPQSEPLPVPIYKLITDNLKPITDNFNEFEKFILKLSIKKPENTLFKPMIKVHSDFYLQRVGVKYKFGKGIDGKAINELIEYFKGAVKPPTDEKILESFSAVLNFYDRWDKFYQGQLKIYQICANLPNIIANIKQVAKKPPENGFMKLREDLLKEIAIDQQNKKLS